MSSTDFKWNALGILNITPDSFSDGGEAIGSGQLEEKINSFRKFNIHHFDIGAESTAPFNNPISADEEWDRFNRYLFPYLNLFKATDVLSFDTYKSEVMIKICTFLKNHHIKNQIIWNDVSGEFDQSVISLLKENENLKYVYSHNLADGRTRTSDHMSFVQPDMIKSEFMKSLINYFEKAFIKIKEVGLQDRVLFDPCFGFSKTLNQNYYLIQELSRLIEAFPSQAWLLGISRKSFLRELVVEESEDLFSREIAQCMILDHWQQQFGRKNVLIRLHDSRIFSTLTQCKKMFELS